MSLFNTTNEIISTYKTQSLQSQFISMIEETIDKEKLLSQKFPPDLISPEKNGKIYFKMTNDNEIHRLFQYKDGLNFDPNEFRPSGCCSGGGLYFTNLENLHLFKGFGKNIRPLFVPNGVPIYDELCTDSSHMCLKTSIKSKAPIIYLLPKIKLGSAQAINLLFNPINKSYNNKMIEDYMYLSDNLPYLNYYRDFYYKTYKIYFDAVNGNSKIALQVNGNSKVALHKQRHPDQAQYIHCEVKYLILQKCYNKLFDIIYYKMKFIDTLYNNSRNFAYENKTVTVSELFYIFLKHQDKTFLKFMKNEYLPRFMQLSHIVKALEPSIELNIPLAINNIKENMEKTIDKNIYDMILKYKGKISGSYALKYLTGMDWKCNDIDIYLPVNLDKLPSNNCIFRNEIVNTVGNTAKVDYGLSQDYNMSNIDEIMNVEQTNGIKLQFIFVKIEPFEFIKDNFDFDFCKCCYNISDSTYEIAHPNLNTIQYGRIDKAYMDKISSYYMKENYSVYRAAKTMDRITKYIERGFIITNLDEFFGCIEKLFDD